MRKLVLMILLLLCSCGSLKKTYLDNIEQGIYNIYIKEKDYIEFFDEAYKENKKDELLYKVLNSELSDEDYEKFFSNKEKNKYYYYRLNDFEKAAELGDLKSKLMLFYENFKSFNFSKALKILENDGGFDKVTIHTDMLLKNKEEFLYLEKLYKKIKNNINTKAELENFEYLIAKYNLFGETTYEVLKPYAKEKDKAFMFSKYKTLYGEGSVSKRILENLVKDNYGPAICEYVKANKITKPNKEMLEKIEKYSKEAYSEIALNKLNKGDIDNLKFYFDNMPKTYKTIYVRAYFSYLYGSYEDAYSKLLKAYKLGINNYDLEDKLLKVTKHLGKEEELLNNLYKYDLYNDEKIISLRFETAKTIEGKKRVALEMWCENRVKASKMLLSLTKDKKKISLYTTIIKML